jgi:hypothetical protein
MVLKPKHLQRRKEKRLRENNRTKAISTTIVIPPP